MRVFYSSTLETPPSITYNQPGAYNINLTVNEGMPNQASYCKEVVVVDSPFIYDITRDEIIRKGTVVLVR